MRTARTMAVGGGGRDWEIYILYEFYKIFDILKKKILKKKIELKKFELRKIWIKKIWIKKNLIKKNLN